MKSAAAISKLDAARRQLVAAIDLFMHEGDPVATHTLACAAAEVIEQLCRRKGIEPFFDDALGANPAYSPRELRAVLNQARNFFKHADTDSNELLEEFSDELNDHILFIASHDYGRLVGAMPVEAQVMEIWWWACHRRWGAETFANEIKRLFPDIESKPRSTQKQMARDALAWGRAEALAGRLPTDATTSNQR